MSLHLYRVIVQSYPTMDGRPFDQQPTGFWQKCIDAHYDPNTETPLPDFMDWDFEEWIYQDGGHYSGYDYPSNNAGVHLRTDPPMVVPVLRRRHWMSRHAANEKAKTLREWGCVVTVEKSEPIKWEGGGMPTDKKRSNHEFW